MVIFPGGTSPHILAIHGVAPQEGLHALACLRDITVGASLDCPCSVQWAAWGRTQRIYAAGGLQTFHHLGLCAQLMELINILRYKWTENQPFREDWLAVLIGGKREGGTSGPDNNKSIFVG